MRSVDILPFPQEIKASFRDRGEKLVPACLDSEQVSTTIQAARRINLEDSLHGIV